MSNNPPATMAEKIARLIDVAELQMQTNPNDGIRLIADGEHLITVPQVEIRNAGDPERTIMDFAVLGAIRRLGA